MASTRYIWAILLATVLSFVLATPVPNHRDGAIDTIHHLDTRKLEKRYHGRMTWYKPGMGNCGKHDSENARVVAIATSVYGRGNHCGQSVEITAHGKTVKAMVHDSCPGCSAGDLDVSKVVFAELGSPDLGVIPISWKFE